MEYKERLNRDIQDYLTSIERLRERDLNDIHTLRSFVSQLSQAHFYTIQLLGALEADYHKGVK